MTEYSRCAKGYFTSTGNAQIINLPFQPNYVTWQDYTTALDGPGASTLVSGTWDVNMGQGNNTILAYSASIGTPLIADVVTPGGTASYGLLGPTNAGLALQYGPVYSYAATGNTFTISTASSALVTTSAPHGLATGNVVVFESLYQSATTGMPQICGIQFVVTVISSTEFTIPWDTTGSHYTAIDTSTSTNNAGAWMQVLYPNLYLPNVSVISAISLGTTTTITTAANHNFVVGQEIAFRIPPVWGTTQLNSLPNNLIPGSPVYGYVIAVTANNQFVCNINSSSYTAFNDNPTVAQAIGLTFPQVLAVGDVNSGGWPYTGGALYPSPSFPTYSGGAPTVNGPAIQGAFVNNTNQGFIIGAGLGTNSFAPNVGSPGDLIYWTAYYFELG